jgi:hypothetical protein
VGGIDAGVEVESEPEIELRQDLMPPMDYGQLDVTVSELFGEVTEGGYPPAIGIRWDTPFAGAFLYRAVVGASAEAIDHAVKGMVMEFKTMHEVYMRSKADRPGERPGEN